MLALIVVWIVVTEIRGGRRSKTFFAHINPEIDTLKTSAMVRYRKIYGKDPTATYPIVTNGHAAPKVQSKKA
jgi:hypothetical protein